MRTYSLPDHNLAYSRSIHRDPKKQFPSFIELGRHNDPPRITLANTEVEVPDLGIITTNSCVALLMAGEAHLLEDL